MRATILSVFLIAVIAIFSFTKPKKPIQDLNGMKKALKIGYSYVPSGKTLIDGDTIGCQGFFMMKEEVSNLSYKEYLFDLRKNGKMDEYKAAQVDSSKWSSGQILAPKYVQHYFNHPAYKLYPVVNVSREQAEKYCEWLTQIWRRNTGNETIVFRLPTRTEFLRAANGSSITRPYAWNSPYLKNGAGNFQCNFLTIGEGAISRDPETGKLIVRDHSFGFPGNSAEGSADFTAPVRSFSPNEFGIYNLNGNVAEMVSGQNLAVGGDWNSPGFDIRNQSTKKFTEANPMVGFRPVMTFVESSKSEKGSRGSSEKMK